VSRPQDLAEFERLVDAHVAPRMADLGYARLGAYVDDQESSRGTLRAVRGGRLRGLLSGRRGTRTMASQDVLFVVGFEAESTEAMARLYPDDPPTGDEVYLYLNTRTGALDFSVGRRLEDLVGEYAEPGESAAILSADEPTAARLKALSDVLDRHVQALLQR
jgi:hypothetical protein